MSWHCRQYGKGSGCKWNLSHPPIFCEIEIYNRPDIIDLLPGQPDSFPAPTSGFTHEGKYRNNLQWDVEKYRVDSFIVRAFTDPLNFFQLSDAIQWILVYIESVYTAYDIVV